ncbi:MAG: DNA translocase FtsK 4TM domain-containing protein [Bdellovibrionota bacterium]
MAKTARKAEKNVPRKRVIEHAPPPPKHTHSFQLEVSAILLVVAAVFIAVALCSQLRHMDSTGAAPGHANVMGPVGSFLASTLLNAFGYCAFVLVAWLVLLARNVCLGWTPALESSVGRIVVVAIASVIFLLACATIASVLIGFSGGGQIGTSAALTLIRFVNEAGTLLAATTLLLLSLGISTGISAAALLHGGRAVAELLLQLCGEGLVMLRSLVSGFGGVLSFPLRNRSERLERRRALPEKSIELPFTLDGETDEIEAEAKPVPVKSRKKLPVPRIEELEDGDEHPAEEDSAAAGNVLILRRDSVEERKNAEKKRLLAASAREKEKTKLSPRAKEFQLPVPDFLVRGESSPTTAPKDTELIHNSKRLEQTLQNFRIGGKVVEVHPGPVITLYQFEPAPGVKVQKIISLADDLALSLKVASVRVYAPVPGKGTVGIEVPNAHREIVRLRDLIETKSFLDPQYQIALALGKDTFGDAYIADLSKMPHLLIAGATGTGKSVCINSLLLSLLYRNTPDELRLILIDPKMLELSVYEDIPHLKAPVVTLAKHARGVLWWAVEEMERRYAMMKDVGVRNLASYNTFVTSGTAKKSARGARAKNEVIELLEKDVVSTSSDLPALDREVDESTPYTLTANHSHEPLPRIVIVVDELADLMLTVGREIEELLTRLAQKARAAGIHLILATQRPSVNVITGLIKANFPSRISFKVASRIDARTVLDNSGAEKLLGQGDMLFLSPGAGRPKRLHSPFVSDKEVHDVVEFIRSQGKPDYDAQIESMIERMEQAESATGADGEPAEYDALYDQAVNLVIEKGMASTSMVQRVFRIGYNRAARILETMERDGVVGPADGAKPRQVLVPHRDAGM